MMTGLGTDCGCGVTVPEGATCPGLHPDCGGVQPKSCWGIPGDTSPCIGDSIPIRWLTAFAGGLALMFMVHLKGYGR